MDGVFFNKDKTKLIRYPEEKTGTGYSIPATVKTVCASAFYHCSQLTSIEIPSSVRIIEDYGISACDSLERITFPESVNSVGEFSFANNTNLKSVTILANSPSVESNAFDNSAVKTVHYAGSETEWNASDWKNAFSSATVDYNYGSLAITQQPKSQSIIAGKPLTLSVKATGDSLQYQWYYKKKGQTTFSPWNNRVSATETVSPNNTWDGIQLYCKITDGSGKTLNSSTVTVSVLSITTQPQSVTVAAGKDATFKVAATGSGLKYQWQYKKSGASAWSNWSSRTTASTTATANDSWNGMQVRCIVTDGAGNKVTSSAATVTIK